MCFQFKGIILLHFDEWCWLKVTCKYYCKCVLWLKIKQEFVFYQYLLHITSVKNTPQVLLHIQKQTLRQTKEKHTEKTVKQMNKQRTEQRPETNKWTSIVLNMTRNKQMNKHRTEQRLETNRWTSIELNEDQKRTDEQA